jgi:hypothetical protein
MTSVSCWASVDSRAVFLPEVADVARLKHCLRTDFRCSYHHDGRRGSTAALLDLGEPLAAGWCTGDDRSVEEGTRQTRESRPHLISS